jgi:hypothetical protein
VAEQASPFVKAVAEALRQEIDDAAWGFADAMFNLVGVRADITAADRELIDIGIEIGRAATLLALERYGWLRPTKGAIE